MKKRVSIRPLIIICLAFLLFSSLVFAQNTVTRSGTRATDGPIKDLSNVINQLFELSSPLFSAILGDSSSTVPGMDASSLYLVKIMFFVIILSLMFMTLQKMPLFSENNFILWAVTIAASILATRWLSNIELVYSFLLPYDVLGLGMAGLLPLVILFFFIEFGLSGRQNQLLRKFGWIFVGILFLFLWITRYDSLVGTSASYGGGVYFISAILCFCFLLFDGTIGKYIAKAKIQKSVAMHNANLANYYNQRIDKIGSLKDDGREGYNSVFRPGLKGESAIRFDLKKYRDEIAKLL